MQPLPQQAHHGILPLVRDSDVADSFRLFGTAERWLPLDIDSRDEAKLLHIVVPIDSPGVNPLLHTYGFPCASTISNVRIQNHSSKYHTERSI